MKKYIIITFLTVISWCSISAEPSKDKKEARHLINKIDVRVNGVNILTSDLEKPRLAKNGKPFTMDEAVFDELLYLRAAELKMLPTDIDIEHQITNFKVQNGLDQLSDNEFEEELKDGGMDLREYKRQYGRLIAVENIKRTETSEKLMVTSQEVERSYKKNPPIQQEAYHLKICVLPQGQHEKSKELVAQNKVEWEDLGFIETTKISKDFAIVPTMKAGDLSEPIKMGDHYELISVVEKKEQQKKTLQESYQEIERELQDEKRDRCLKDLEKDLKAKASIVYL